VLEIGSGSGRAASKLLEDEIDIIAVEPSAGMRAAAVAAHPELRSVLHPGALPDALPAEAAGPFDAVLLSAVIMHIPDAELFNSAFELRQRLRPGGRLILSMPLERQDIVPGSDRDIHGRLMIVRSVPQVRLLFERLGFEIEGEWKSPDSIGRSILWVTLVFRKDGTGSRAIDRVESIINADRKVATYKLALIRALCDVALTTPALARWGLDGSVGVPLMEVSRRWLLYYWPLVDQPAIVPQMAGEAQGGRPIAFRAALTQLANLWKRQGGFIAFARAFSDDSLSPDVRKLCSSTLKAIGNTVLRGPVQYAGNARGGPEFDFDPKTFCIKVPADVWRELSLMGHWVRDAVVLRWAELTAHFSNGQLQRGAVLDILLSAADPWRMDPAVRALYQDRFRQLRCVWTGEVLRRDFEVDHAIPFAFWQASPTWNLLPALRRVNNEKRDRLPTHGLIARRSACIVEAWRTVKDAMPARFLKEASELAGFIMPNDWERPLLSAFLEAVEYTATMRGAERWEPTGS
jgi:hypothetical protein